MVASITSPGAAVAPASTEAVATSSTRLPTTSLGQLIGFQ